MSSAMGAPLEFVADLAPGRSLMKSVDGLLCGWHSGPLIRRSVAYGASPFNAKAGLMHIKLKPIAVAMRSRGFSASLIRCIAIRLETQQAGNRGEG